jgi:hypothetical protein
MEPSRQARPGSRFEVMHTEEALLQVHREIIRRGSTLPFCNS